MEHQGQGWGQFELKSVNLGTNWNSNSIIEKIEKDLFIKVESIDKSQWKLLYLSSYYLKAIKMKKNDEVMSENEVI